MRDQANRKNHDVSAADDSFATVSHITPVIERLKSYTDFVSLMYVLFKDANVSVSDQGKFTVAPPNLTHIGISSVFLTHRINMLNKIGFLESIINTPAEAAYIANNNLDQYPQDDAGCTSLCEALLGKALVQTRVTIQDDSFVNWEKISADYESKYKLSLKPEDAQNLLDGIKKGEAILINRERDVRDKIRLQHWPANNGPH